jgi:hypothetical protein
MIGLVVFFKVVRRASKYGFSVFFLKMVRRASNYGFSFYFILKW